MLLSTLRVQGFAAVEDGGFVKIVPEAEAKTSAEPDGRGGARVPGDRIVTQVFILQNENAVQLVPVLRPLVTANNFIAAYPEQQRDRHHRLREQRAAHPAHHRVDRPALGARTCRSCACRTPRRSTSRRCCSAWCPRRPRRANAPGTHAQGRGRRGHAHQQPHRARRQPALMTRIKTLALGLDTPGAGNGNIYTVFLRNAEAVKHRRDAARPALGQRDLAHRPRPRRTPAGQHRHADHGLDHAGAPPATRRSRRAQLDDPGLSADQLDHHHRARAGLPGAAHRDRQARPAPRAGLRRGADRRGLHRPRRRVRRAVERRRATSATARRVFGGTNFSTGSAGHRTSSASPPTRAPSARA